MTGPETEPELSPLERMTLLERLQADYETQHLTTGVHPMKQMRVHLPDLLRPTGELKNIAHGDRVKIDTRV